MKPGDLIISNAEGTINECIKIKVLGTLQVITWLRIAISDVEDNSWPLEQWFDQLSSAEDSWPLWGKKLPVNDLMLYSHWRIHARFLEIVEEMGEKDAQR